MTRRCIFALAFILVLFAATAPPLVAGQPQQPPPAQSEFVPLDQLPPEEQLPAAPLVIAAYAVAWVGIFIYLASIWRRLQRVEKDLAEVAGRIAERSRT